MEHKNKWNPDVDYKQIPKDVIIFMYNEGVKKLESILSIRDSITQKSYILLSITIPLLSVLVSNVINQRGWIQFVSISCTIISIIAILLLYKLIKPRGGFEIGIDPKIICKKEEMDFSGMKDEHKVSVIYFYELSHVQDKITQMRNQNIERTNTFNMVLFMFVITSVVALAHIVTIYI